MTIAELQRGNPKDKIYASFGEIMLRLSSPGFERLFQSPLLNTTFGGGEANVAVSLALQGLKSRFVTLLPKNDIAEGAMRMLKGHGVDASKVVLVDGARMGIYFMEKGANQRPSRVIYDRLPSAISEMGQGSIDWDKALSGCGWFHITGITPALSKNTADGAIAAMEAARKVGAVVSIDLNYRAKLWKYVEGSKGVIEVMDRLTGLSGVVIANEEDCQKSLGIGTDIDPGSGKIDEGRYERLAKDVLDRYPNLKLIAITLRESVSASHNRWGAMLSDGKETLFSKKYDITHIVDRVGGGDSFSAGLIYGLSHFSTLGDALEYAACASCLCHSIEGDMNLSTNDEIMALFAGDKSGRIKR
ncbi:MAG: sugar kinase [Deltaproteobacteria bacterium]|uniref:Sugar kinase n=1 Tax=Candidatus Zymogenus saltonus TaxID=2844893 RepID=A0A9D8KF77_9DELT|nr:sugar kinase [Candidatus Zymogenus saltonus]